MVFSSFTMYSPGQKSSFQKCTARSVIEIIRGLVAKAKYIKCGSFLCGIGQLDLIIIGIQSSIGSSLLKVN